MGNKGDKCTYTGIPLDDILSDFNEIKTSDGIRWIRANFKETEVMLNVINSLQTSNYTLINKSYSYLRSKSNRIQVNFMLHSYSKLFHQDIKTSFCYTPQLKS